MKQNQSLTVMDARRMTSLEIAEVTGKQHKNLMRDIRNMEAAWEKTCGLKFELTSRTINQPWRSEGQVIDCFEKSITCPHDLLRNQSPVPMIFSPHD